MILNSFGNAYELTGVDAYRRVVLDAAASLATRFSPVVGCTRSWNSSSADEFTVIIDNMMNLELLFWGARNGGNPAWRGMAVSHALKTIENHVRPDGSVHHIVDFDPNTGAVRREASRTGQERRLDLVEGPGLGASRIRNRVPRNRRSSLPRDRPPHGRLLPGQPSRRPGSVLGLHGPHLRPPRLVRGSHRGGGAARARSPRARWRPCRPLFRGGGGDPRLTLVERLPRQGKLESVGSPPWHQSQARRLLRHRPRLRRLLLRGGAAAVPRAGGGRRCRWPGAAAAREPSRPHRERPRWQAFHRRAVGSGTACSGQRARTRPPRCVDDARAAPCETLGTRRPSGHDRSRRAPAGPRRLDHRPGQGQGPRSPPLRRARRLRVKLRIGFAPTQGRRLDRVERLTLSRR